jgi:GTP cyclohydrolase I
LGDVNREGLEKTPERVETMQYLTWIRIRPLETKISTFTEDHKQMMVKDIEVYSMCEHHMLPFGKHM